MNDKCLFYISNLENKKEQEHVVSHMWLLQINQYTSNVNFNAKYLQWAICNSKSIPESWQVTINNKT